MAGVFVGVAGVQQMQLSGSAPPYGSVPMVGGNLYVYAANTSSPSSTFQDIGLTVPSTNPLVLDQTGRVPQFYVADGFYRIRLQDASGVITNGGFDYPSVPSIGASTSGGGGGGVDPTTILSTGDFKWQPIQGVLAGFVRANGRTIGSAISGASERANADCQPLFLWIWNNVVNTYCPVIGGRGASAAADWAANRQITLIDLRARGQFGVDDMGNAASGRLTSVSTSTPTAAASSGGADSVALSIAQLPSHNHPLTDLGHNHIVHSTANAAPTGSGFGTVQAAAGPFDQNTSTNTTGITIAAVGSNNAHLSMSPFVLGTFYQKL